MDEASAFRLPRLLSPHRRLMRQRRSGPASGSGAAAVPRRQRTGRLAAARGRRPECRSAGARGAAGVRVQSAGRQPADHVREVCGRQQEPADGPDQRLTRQQRFRHCRQALRLRRDRDRRTGGGALGVDHRRWTGPPGSGRGPSRRHVPGDRNDVESAARRRLIRSRRSAPPASTRSATPRSRTTAATPAAAGAAPCWAARTSRPSPCAGHSAVSGRTRAS